MVRFLYRNFLVEFDPSWDLPYYAAFFTTYLYAMTVDEIKSKIDLWVSSNNSL